jgi:NAD-dependent dihydropyrimidine dehydrogenase PreA subunit
MRVVEGLFEKLSEYFVVNSSMCVRVRHKNASCTDCTDVCPAEAIRITSAGGKVLVDWTLCTDCGKCLNSCRNSVFVPRRADLRSMDVSSVEQIKENGAVRYSCFRAGAAAGGCRTSSLSRVGRKQIIKAVSMGALRQEFVHGDCGKCPVSGCKDDLEKELAFSRRVLELCGRTAEFEIRRFDEKPAPKAKKSMMEERFGKSEVQLTRREFFGFIRNRAGESVGKTLHYFSENDKNRQKTVLDVKGGIAPHEEYLASLESLGGEILIRNMMKEGLLSRAEIITETCTKCGICARLCPFGVFVPVIETVKGRKVTAAVNVDTAKCTGCGVCLVSCPTDSIKLSKAGL